jgi:multiple antibiotic resistance protein
MPTCSIVPCWMLLHIGVELEDKRSSEARSHSTAIDSFYPLTMPVTVGPGSIAVAIGLGSQRPEGPLTLSQFALLGGSAIAGVVALTFTVYVCYRFAKRTTALLDEKRCQCRSCPLSFSRASAFKSCGRATAR